MGNVKIAAHYTKDTRINNGLDSIQQQLTDDPDAVVVVVGVVKVLRTGVEVQDGHRPTVTADLFAIEPVFGDDAMEVRTIHERAVKTRTGGQVAPTLFDGHGQNLDDEDEDGNADEDDADAADD